MLNRNEKGRVSGPSLSLEANPVPTKSAIENGAHRRLALTFAVHDSSNAPLAHAFYVNGLAVTRPIHLGLGVIFS
jgi:hypothetical protein